MSMTCAHAAPAARGARTIEEWAAPLSLAIAEGFCAACRGPLDPDYTPTGERPDDVIAAGFCPACRWFYALEAHEQGSCGLRLSFDHLEGPVLRRALEAQRAKIARIFVAME